MMKSIYPYRPFHSTLVDVPEGFLARVNIIWLRDQRDPRANLNEARAVLISLLPITTDWANEESD
jgi:hypothetical protein